MAQIGAGAGSSNGIYKHEQPKQQKRSKFDLSRITNFTCDSGMIIPFDFFETLPNDTFQLSAEVALETLPTITNVLTPYHVRTHWYYVRNSDLWKGWNTFITKGRTGNIELKIPKINPNQKYTSTTTNSVHDFTTPHSLQSFLGCLPVNIKNTAEDQTTTNKNYLPYAKDETSATFENYTKTNYQNVTDGVNALPFMAYQAICKYNYVDQNLLQENKALFPDEGDSEWRIPYNWNQDGTGFITTVSGHDKHAFDSDIEPYVTGIYRANDTEVMLTELRYAPFEEDYFTSALPWQQRGQLNTLDMSIDLSGLEANFTNGYTTVHWKEPDSSTGSTDTNANNTVYQINSYATTPNIQAQINAKDFFQSKGFDPEDYENFKIWETPHGTIRLNTSDPINAGTSITANQLRELLALSVWQERNARVNGSYNSMIWIHFNHDPKVQDHYPIFIGGTSSYIEFGEVTQTSQSTEDSPQGTVTSKGNLYDTQQIGTFECPDYGFIMGILIISPITTYNTTQPEELIKKDTMEDYFFPEFEELGMEAILNKEILTVGIADKDNDLWGWQERNSYLKTRQNVNRGLFRLESEQEKLFSSATQSREFKNELENREAPRLSYQFKTQSPQNTRRDWLAYPSEPMFKVQIASKVTATRNMAYTATPNTFGF